VTAIRSAEGNDEKGLSVLDRRTTGHEDLADLAVRGSADLGDVTERLDPAEDVAARHGVAGVPLACRVEETDRRGMDALRLFDGRFLERGSDVGQQITQAAVTRMRDTASRVPREDVDLAGHGCIRDYVVAERGAEGFPVPYVQAWVTLDAGPVVFSIVETDSPREFDVPLGTAVTLVPREFGSAGDVFRGWACVVDAAAADE